MPSSTAAAWARKDGTTAEGKRELIRALRTSSDHHAHALRRGPDGWIYLIAGDSTGIDASFATLPTSPIRKPLAGCLVRFSPDFKHSEIVADGFRNPYAFDFDAEGFIWTYDADNERCVSLPWYEPTRIYRVIPGQRSADGRSGGHRRCRLISPTRAAHRHRRPRFAHRRRRAQTRLGKRGFPRLRRD